MKRLAVITGASSGIGKEFARQIAADAGSPKLRRYKVDEIFLIARRKERLEEIAAEISEECRVKSAEGGAERALPPVPVVIAADVSGQAGAEILKKTLEEAGGAENIEVAILVNNAGFGLYGPFQDSDEQKDMDMVDVNCTAVVGITAVCLPYMRRGGVIINTASLAAFMPLGNFALYAATKAFVLSFSVGIAAELEGRGIKVCALCPGPVSTEFSFVASGGARKEVKHGVSAEKVVRHCLNKAAKGKSAAIMKWKWKLAAFFSKLLPRMLCARFTYKFCPRPYMSVE